MDGFHTPVRAPCFNHCTLRAPAAVLPPHFPLPGRSRPSKNHPTAVRAHGRVAEWFKAPDSKLKSGLLQGFANLHNSLIPEPFDGSWLFTDWRSFSRKLRATVVLTAPR